MEEEKHITGLMRNLKNELKNILTQSYVDPNLVSDKEAMKELIIKVMADLYEITVKSGIEMDEIFQLVELKKVNKKQVERIRNYSLELGKFLEKGFVVLTGNPEVMLKQLGKYIRHAENVWNDAVSMYQKQRFSMACFLSIVCIEECSKISFGEFQYYHRILHEEPKGEKKPRGKNPLSQHSKKHFIAACSGALVNTRMDNLLGIDKVAEFIENCESGQLEKLRQMSLYADINKEGAVLVPEERITKEQSLFYVCLAGELLSQIEGAESFRGGFQDKLDKFEAENIKKE